MKRFVTKVLTICVMVTLSFGVGSAHAETVISEVPPSATSPDLRDRFDGDGQQAQPMVWGAVIRVLGSKSACEGVRATYHSLFPDSPRLTCVKSGKVWLLVRR